MSLTINLLEGIKMSEMHKWKKKSYLTVKIRVDDTFFAVTPDLSGTSEYPFTHDAKVKIMDMKVDRHTIEMDTNQDKPTQKEDKPTY